MPDCIAKGVKEDWPVPKLVDEMEWASNLTEKAIREEDDLIRATTEEKVAYIAFKAEEDIAFKAEEAAKASRAIGVHATATEGEEEASEDDVAGEHQEESEHQEEPAGEETVNVPEEEPEPQAPKKARVLRKASGQEVAPFFIRSWSCREEIYHQDWPATRS
jgi:hypothetical protein